MQPPHQSDPVKFMNRSRSVFAASVLAASRFEPQASAPVVACRLEIGLIDNANKLRVFSKCSFIR